MSRNLVQNRRVNNAFDWLTWCDINHPSALHRLYVLSTRKAFGSTRAFLERLKNAKLLGLERY